MSFLLGDKLPVDVSSRLIFVLVGGPRLQLFMMAAMEKFVIFDPVWSDVVDDVDVVEDDGDTTTVGGCRIDTEDRLGDIIQLIFFQKFTDF